MAKSNTDTLSQKAESSETLGRLDKQQPSMTLEPHVAIPLQHFQVLSMFFPNILNNNHYFKFYI